MSKDVHTGYFFSLYHHNDNDNGYVDNYTTSVSFARNRATTTSSNPKYKQVIASRGNAVYPYTRWNQTCRSNFAASSLDYKYFDAVSGTNRTGRLRVSGHPVVRSYAGDYFGPVSQPIPADIMNLLTVSYFKAVKSKSTELDGAVSLGEMRETLHGIRNPAKSLRKGLSGYLNDVKKRCSGIKKLDRTLHVIKDTYLEWSFGWRPLLSDIDSAGKALNSQLDTFERSERIGVSQTWTTQSNMYDRTVTDARAWFAWDVYHIADYQHKVRMFGAIHRPGKQNIYQHLGLTPSNWLPAAWELLPFSFVTDYFINIGNCLSALGTSTKNVQYTGLSHVMKGSDTYHGKANQSYSSLTLAPYGLTVTSIFHADNDCVFPLEYFNRTRLDVADLWVIPTITLPSLSTQWINLSFLAKELKDISQSVFRR